MVDYNKYAKTFAKSRKGLKWEEINYFLDNLGFFSGIKILDIGAGSGRLYGELCNKFGESNFDYTGLELSSGLITEAEKQYPEINMVNLNMLDIDELSKQGKKYDVVFFIASFHHLKSLEERNIVLNKLKNVLNKNAKIYFTNWALNSEKLDKIYNKNKIVGSKNEFGSEDYEIPIAEFTRYYHAFTLEELEFIFEKNDYNIVENKLFSNNKNYISIINKK